MYIDVAVGSYLVKVQSRYLLGKNGSVSKSLADL